MLLEDEFETPYSNSNEAGHLFDQALVVPLDSTFYISYISKMV
jgi:hypothetical protein